MTKCLFYGDKMTAHELNSSLHRLDLEPKEAAQLLGVNPRTFRRWLDNSQEIPVPAERAINAWMQMEALGLAWRPDSVSLVECDSESIAANRNHVIGLTETLERVTKRGGPASPWIVDIEKRCATLGPIKLSFHPLKNGGFSPSFYSRRDCSPDLKRDQHLIEDAIACIANAYATSNSEKSADL
jgi:hypothetical protein